MTDIHEPTYQSNWKLDDAPEEYVQMMLKAIVGIEITIDGLIGKFKLSQNRPPEDYEAVVEQIEQSPMETLQAMREYMKKP
jgi:transcriptional regulator